MFSTAIYLCTQDCEVPLITQVCTLRTGSLTRFRPVLWPQNKGNLITAVIALLEIVLSSASLSAG